MNKNPIFLPVFSAEVPLDFPPEGNFAFNKVSNTQFEVTMRINEHQYFNMDFVNIGGYIMALTYWAHVMDFAENGFDRYEHTIKKHFRKKYPTVAMLYGQHTDTAEDIHFSTIGFEGHPKEWYLSMRIYGEDFEDFFHGNPLINTTFLSAVGNLCEASMDVFRELMKSDAKQPKALLQELTGLTEIDEHFSFGNYFEARNPETHETLTPTQEGSKGMGVLLPKPIKPLLGIEDLSPSDGLKALLDTLDDNEYLTLANTLYYEIKAKEKQMLGAHVIRDNFCELMEYRLSRMGDSAIHHEELTVTDKMAFTALASTFFTGLLLHNTRHLYLDEPQQCHEDVVEMEKNLSKLFWRDWHTDYFIKEQQKRVLQKGIADAIDKHVKMLQSRFDNALKAMNYEQFMEFHDQLDLMMKSKLATLKKYNLLSKMEYQLHIIYWGQAYKANEDKDTAAYEEHRAAATAFTSRFYANLLVYGYQKCQDKAKSRYAQKIAGDMDRYALMAR